MAKALCVLHPDRVTLSGQARYAAGTLEILQCVFAGKPIKPEYLMVDGGNLVRTGAGSCKLD